MSSPSSSGNRPFLVSAAQQGRPSPSQVRERLYQISLGAIRNQEFDSVPVSRITGESGVAKGTFFNYFPTKEHLLARVLDEMMDRAFQGEEGGPAGTDAIAAALDGLTGELADDPPLARAIIPRMAILPPPPRTMDADTDGSQPPPSGSERLRRWIRDRLAESLRISVPLEEADDQTLSVLLLATFEITLREWLATTHGEPPFPRRLLHGRIAYLLSSAGFPRPPQPT
jgi:AcrR family transcriptional regulator